MGILLTGPPPEGIWRIGRDPDPLSASKSVSSSELSKPGTGNRFDSPTGGYGVRYFGTGFDGCFGETLARFRPDLDIESVDTREAMRDDLAELLAYYHYPDLDVALVRGRDRRVTRYISQWVFEQTDEGGQPLYAGIRYLSRLNSEWECWAVFDDVEMKELERRPIRREDASYQRIAKLYGLTPY